MTFEPRGHNLVLLAPMPESGARDLAKGLSAKVREQTGLEVSFWVMPLAAYLLSFILTFDRPGTYKPRVASLGTGVLLFAAAAFHRAGTNDTIFSLLQILSILAATFGLSMVCHGELARLKPGPRHLTSYYLSLAAGGALGGVFVNFVAPKLFASFLEWKVGIGIAYAGSWALFAWHPGETRYEQLVQSYSDEIWHRWEPPFPRAHAASSIAHPLARAGQ